MGISSDACLKRAFKPYQKRKRNPYLSLDWLVVCMFVLAFEFSLTWYYLIAFSLTGLLALTLNLMKRRWDKKATKSDLLESI